MTGFTRGAGRFRRCLASSDELRGAWAALLAASALLACLAAIAAPAAPGCAEPRLLRPAAADGARSAAVACNARDSGLPALRGPARLLFGRALDLNTASAQDLEVLPRIGPRRAAAIVHARRERRFERPEDLQRVEGIGPRTVAGLAGWLEVHAAGLPGPAELPEARASGAR